MKNNYFCGIMFHRMFWPALVAGVCFSCADVVDSVVLGTGIGAAGLAAIGLVTPLYLLYNVIGYAFSVGGSISVSRDLGEGQAERANLHFNDMLLLLLAAGACIAVAGNALARPILWLLGVGPEDGELYGMCLGYARVLLAFAPLLMLTLYLHDQLSADNDQLLATIGSVATCGVDIALNILLVIVLRKGVTGSIWATVCGQTVNLLVLLMHFALKRGALRLRPALPDRERLRAALASVRTGLATSFRYIYRIAYELVANNLLMRLSAGSGEMYVAIFNVVQNVSYLTDAVANSAVSALQPLAATFHAEHNEGDLRGTLRLSLLYGAGLSAVLAAALACFAGPAARIFGLEGPDVRFAIRLFCVSVPFDAVTTILTGCFQSIDRERFSGVIAAIRTFLVPIPLAVILCLIGVDLFWYVSLAAALPGCAAAAAAALWIARRRREDRTPVYTHMLRNDDRDIGVLLDGIVAFCEEHGATPRQTNRVNMAAEEVCANIIQNAFTGSDREYIQVTVVRESDTDFVLHLRDNAVVYDPLSAGRQGSEDPLSEAFMDSVGILMLRKKAKELYYRRYQGFNVLTVRV